jgi:hypothetical protein
LIIYCAKFMQHTLKLVALLPVVAGIVLFVGAGFASAQTVDGTATSTTATESGATATPMVPDTGTTTDTNESGNPSPQENSAEATSTPTTPNTGTSSTSTLSSPLLYASSDNSTIYSADTYGHEEVPPAPDTSPGYIEVGLDSDSNSLSYAFALTSGKGITAAHLHCARPGENGPIVLTLYMSTGNDVDGTFASGAATDADILASAQSCSDTIGYEITSIRDIQRALDEGNIYVNAHSSEYPDGVSRGQLQFVRSNANTNASSSVDDSSSPNDTQSVMVPTTESSEDNSNPDSGSDNTNPSPDEEDNDSSNTTTNLSPEQMDYLIGQFFE